MRLIDYDEIRKLFDEEYKRTAQLIRDGQTHLDNLAEGYVGADKVIYKLPDVDAVEVVRCKKCRHYNPGGCDNGFGWCEYYNSGATDDHYCSHGERRLIK